MKSACSNVCSGRRNQIINHVSKLKTFFLINSIAIQSDLSLGMTNFPPDLSECSAAKLLPPWTGEELESASVLRCASGSNFQLPLSTSKRELPRWPVIQWLYYGHYL